MSKTEQAFKNGKAFIPFLTCGDPDLETTEKLVRAMASAGADLIELGIPFSDPTAEGPVIQAANIRALAGGVTTDKIFDMVSKLRNDITIPLAFMTYANVVFSYGIDRFMSICRDIGIDAIILPDVPYEEKNEFELPALKNGIDFISLIAPTSEGRIAKISEDASGFIYLVSSMGVTGMRGKIETDLSSIVNTVRQHSKVPCAIGFGISSTEQCRNMAELSDGAIVGSAIVNIIAKYGRESVPYVESYVNQMKYALSNVQ